MKILSTFVGLFCFTLCLFIAHADDAENYRRNRRLYWSNFDYPIEIPQIQNVRCPSGFTFYKNYCFQLIPYQMGRKQASRYCQRLNGWLSVPRDRDRYKIFVTYLTSINIIDEVITDMACDGETCDDDFNPRAALFAAGERFLKGFSRCLGFKLGRSKWNHLKFYNCDRKMKFICESNPAPLDAVFCDNGKRYFMPFQRCTGICRDESDFDYPQCRPAQTFCDQELNVSPSVKILTSLNYPQNYSDNSECKYIFTSDQISSYILLTMVACELESYYDTLTIYTGIEPSSTEIFTKIAKCPTNLPAKYLITSSSALVTFTSDSSRNMKGFNFTYVSVTSVCNLIAINGTITSPVNIDNDTSCVVSIPSFNDSLLMVFMIQEYNCDPSQSIINIYNGTDDSATLYGNFTGNSLSKSPPIFILKSSAYVKFTTYSVTNKCSFRLTYQSGCNVSLSHVGDKGIYTSPGYNFDGYLNNLTCCSTFKAPVNTTIPVRAVINNYNVEPNQDFIIGGNFQVNNSANASVFYQISNVTNGTEFQFCLVSDLSVTYPGFLLTWSRDCNHPTLLGQLLKYSESFLLSCGTGEVYGSNFSTIRNQSFTCSWGGQLNVSVSKCFKKNCGPPTKISNTQVSWTSSGFGSIAKYACNDGFQFSGNNTAVCDYNGWIFNQNVPQCVEIQCPPPTITDPQLTYTPRKNSFKLLDKIEFSCGKNYRINGPQQARCLLGSFSEIPQCIVPACNLPLYYNGVKGVMPNNRSVNVGSFVTLVCKPGYQPDGPSVSYCNSNGQLNVTQFRCKDINECQLNTSICGMNPCINFVGGYSCKCASGYRLSSNNLTQCLDINECAERLDGCSQKCINVVGSYECACEPGFFLYNSSLISWGKTNIRQRVLKYLTLDKTCLPLYCDLPFSNSRRRVLGPTDWLFSSNSNKMTIGSWLRYKASNGYVYGKKWTEAIATCIYNQTINLAQLYPLEPTFTFGQCPDVLEIENGNVNVTSTDYGTELPITCKYGQVKMGEAKVVCVQSQLNSSNYYWMIKGVCSSGSSECPSLGVIQHGTVVYYTKPCSLAIYLCDKDYLLVGERFLTCGRDGIWSGTPPRCEYATCSPLISRSQVTNYSPSSNGNQVALRSLFTATCPISGYVLNETVAQVFGCVEKNPFENLRINYVHSRFSCGSSNVLVGCPMNSSVHILQANYGYELVKPSQCGKTSKPYPTSPCGSVQKSTEITRYYRDNNMQRYYQAYIPAHECVFSDSVSLCPSNTQLVYEVNYMCLYYQQKLALSTPDLYGIAACDRSDSLIHDFLFNSQFNVSNVNCSARDVQQQRTLCISMKSLHLNKTNENMIVVESAKMISSQICSDNSTLKTKAIDCATCWSNSFSILSKSLCSLGLKRCLPSKCGMNFVEQEFCPQGSFITTNETTNLVANNMLAPLQNRTFMGYFFNQSDSKIIYNGYNLAEIGIPANFTSTNLTFGFTMGLQINSITLLVRGLKNITRVTVFIADRPNFPGYRNLTNAVVKRPRDDVVMVDFSTTTVVAWAISIVFDVDDIQEPTPSNILINIDYSIYIPSPVPTTTYCYKCEGVRYDSDCKMIEMCNSQTTSCYKRWINDPDMGVFIESAGCVNNSTANIYNATENFQICSSSGCNAPGSWCPSVAQNTNRCTMNQLKIIIQSNFTVTTVSNDRINQSCANALYLFLSSSNGHAILNVLQKSPFMFCLNNNTQSNKFKVSVSGIGSQQLNIQVVAELSVNQLCLSMMNVTMDGASSLLDNITTLFDDDGQVCPQILLNVSRATTGAGRQAQVICPEPQEFVYFGQQMRACLQINSTSRFFILYNLRQNLIADKMARGFQVVSFNSSNSFVYRLPPQPIPIRLNWGDHHIIDFINNTYNSVYSLTDFYLVSNYGRVKMVCVHARVMIANSTLDQSMTELSCVNASLNRPTRLFQLHLNRVFAAFIQIHVHTMPLDLNQPETIEVSLAYENRSYFVPPFYCYQCTDELKEENCRDNLVLCDNVPTFQPVCHSHWRFNGSHSLVTKGCGGPSMQFALADCSLIKNVSTNATCALDCTEEKCNLFGICPSWNTTNPCRRDLNLFRQTLRFSIQMNLVNNTSDCLSSQITQFIRSKLSCIANQDLILKLSSTFINNNQTMRVNFTADLTVFYSYVNLPKCAAVTLGRKGLVNVIMNELGNGLVLQQQCSTNATNANSNMTGFNNQTVSSMPNIFIDTNITHNCAVVAKLGWALCQDISLYTALPNLRFDYTVNPTVTVTNGTGGNIPVDNNGYYPIISDTNITACINVSTPVIMASGFVNIVGKYAKFGDMAVVTVYNNGSSYIFNQSIYFYHNFALTGFNINNMSFADRVCINVSILNASLETQPALFTFNIISYSTLYNNDLLFPMNTYSAFIYYPYTLTQANGLSITTSSGQELISSNNAILSVFMKTLLTSIDETNCTFNIVVQFQRQIALRRFIVQYIPLNGSVNPSLLMVQNARLFNFSTDSEYKLNNSIIYWPGTVYVDLMGKFGEQFSATIILSQGENCQDGNIRMNIETSQNILDLIGPNSTSNSNLYCYNCSSTNSSQCFLEYCPSPWQRCSLTYSATNNSNNLQMIQSGCSSACYESTCNASNGSSCLSTKCCSSSLCNNMSLITGSPKPSISCYQCQDQLNEENCRDNLITCPTSDNANCYSYWRYNGSHSLVNKGCTSSQISDSLLQMKNCSLFNDGLTVNTTCGITCTDSQCNLFGLCPTWNATSFCRRDQNLHRQNNTFYIQMGKNGTGMLSESRGCVLNVIEQSLRSSLACFQKENLLINSTSVMMNDDMVKISTNLTLFYSFVNMPYSACASIIQNGILNIIKENQVENSLKQQCFLNQTEVILMNATEAYNTVNDCAMFATQLSSIFCEDITGTKAPTNLRYDYSVNASTTVFNGTQNIARNPNGYYPIQTDSTIRACVISTIPSNIYRFSAALVGKYARFGNQSSIEIYFNGTKSTYNQSIDLTYYFTAYAGDGSSIPIADQVCIVVDVINVNFDANPALFSFDIYHYAAVDDTINFPQNSTSLLLNYPYVIAPKGFSMISPDGVELKTEDYFAYWSFYKVFLSGINEKLCTMNVTIHMSKLMPLKRFVFQYLPNNGTVDPTLLKIQNAKLYNTTDSNPNATIISQLTFNETIQSWPGTIYVNLNGQSGQFFFAIIKISEGDSCQNGYMRVNLESVSSLAPFYTSSNSSNSTTSLTCYKCDNMTNEEDCLNNVVQCDQTMTSKCYSYWIFNGTHSLVNKGCLNNAMLNSSTNVDNCSLINNLPINATCGAPCSEQKCNGFGICPAWNTSIACRRDKNIYRESQTFYIQMIESIPIVPSDSINCTKLTVEDYIRRSLPCLSNEQLMVNTSIDVLDNRWLRGIASISIPYSFLNSSWCVQTVLVKKGIFNVIVNEMQIQSDLDQKCKLNAAVVMNFNMSRSVDSICATIARPVSGLCQDVSLMRNVSNLRYDYSINPMVTVFNGTYNISANDNGYYPLSTNSTIQTCANVSVKTAFFTIYASLIGRYASFGNRVDITVFDKGNQQQLMLSPQMYYYFAAVAPIYLAGDGFCFTVNVTNIFNETAFFSFNVIHFPVGGDENNFPMNNTSVFLNYTNLLTSDGLSIVTNSGVNLIPSEYIIPSVFNPILLTNVNSNNCTFNITARFKYQVPLRRFMVQFTPVNGSVNPSLLKLEGAMLVNKSNDGNSIPMKFNQTFSPWPGTLFVDLKGQSGSMFSVIVRTSEGDNCQDGYVRLNLESTIDVIDATTPRVCWYCNPNVNSNCSMQMCSLNQRSCYIRYKSVFSQTGYQSFTAGCYPDTDAGTILGCTSRDDYCLKTCSDNLCNTDDFAKSITILDIQYLITGLHVTNLNITTDMMKFVTKDILLLLNYNIYSPKAIADTFVNSTIFVNAPSMNITSPTTPTQEIQAVWGDNVPICIDVQAPVLSKCWARIQYELGPSGAKAVNFTLPIVTDNSMANISIQNSFINFTQSPFVFSSNVTMNLTATDARNNSISCLTTIELIDRTAPVVTCPPSPYIQIISSMSSPMSGILVLPVVTVFDQSNQTTISYNIENGTEVYLTYPVTVVVMATDNSGNIGSCSYQHIVLTAPCENTSLILRTQEKNIRLESCGPLFGIANIWSCNLKCPTSSVFPAMQTDSDPLSVTCDKTSSGIWEPTYIPECSPLIGRRQILYWFNMSMTTNMCLANMTSMFMMNMANMSSMPMPQECLSNYTTSFVNLTLLNNTSIMSSNVTWALNFDFVPMFGISELALNSCMNAVHMFVVRTCLSRNDSQIMTQYNSTCRPGEMSFISSNVKYCVLCQRGQYYNQTSDSCIQCPQGTYSDLPGSLTCTPCPYGTTTKKETAVSSRQCIITCQPGYASSNGFPPCNICAKGYYSSTMASTSCSQCPANQTTYSVGSSNAAMCSQPCQPGNFSETGLEPCLPCPVNTYQNSSGKTTCMFCSVGLYTTSVGTVNESSCQPLNPCLPNPCTHGTCSQQLNRYTCSCDTGYMGDNCSVLIDLCAIEKPCMNGGNCSQNSNFTVTCTCPPGYIGERCDIIQNLCDNNYCQNGGTCLPSFNSYECRCPFQYTGANCTQSTSVCVTSPPCKNNATCITGNNETNPFFCDCSKTDYIGTLCDTFDDPCVSQICYNGGQCVNRLTDNTLSGKQFKCNCASGWQNVTCSDDINECAMNASLCLNNGTCINTNGSYYCDCLDGFNGTMCEVDVDECLSQPCLNNATCYNLPGRFACTCQPGFEGEKCDQKIDFCVNNTCSQNGTELCASGTSNYTCMCKLGYQGTFCDTFISMCNTWKPCQNNASCFDTVGNYTCECPPGYSGVNCSINIDDCSPNPCVTGTCLDLVNGFLCNCSSGYNGTRCESEIDLCVLNGSPCVNGATCQTANSTRRCLCLPGYSGDNCSVNIDDCASEPCLNGGNCTDLVNGFTCSCNSNYTDAVCSTRRDPCTVIQPCQNGGFCLTNSTAPGGFVCVCSVGYNGSLCQNNPNDCPAESLCQNGGVCIDGLNAFTCSCPSNYSGLFCEKVKQLGYDLYFQPNCPASNTSRAFIQATASLTSVTSLDLITIVRYIVPNSASFLILTLNNSTSITLSGTSVSVVVGGVAKSGTIQINNGQWFAIKISLGNSQLTADLNSTRVVTLPFNMTLLSPNVNANLTIGGDPTSNDAVAFQGEVSQVYLTKNSLTTDQWTSSYGNISKLWSLVDLTSAISWSMFDIPQGVVCVSKTVPSRVYTANCPVGFTSANCQSAIDIQSPTVTYCPSTISVVDPDNAINVVNFTEPTFTDNVGITFINKTVSPNTALPYGTTQVTYTANDAAGNVASCQFNIVRSWSNCSPPNATNNFTIVSCGPVNSLLYCTVQCIDVTQYGFSSDENIPPGYTCDETGSWSPSFTVLPTCTRKTTPLVTLTEAGEPFTSCDDVQKNNSLYAYFNKLKSANIRSGGHVCAIGSTPNTADDACNWILPKITIKLPGCDVIGRRRRRAAGTSTVALTGVSSAQSSALCSAAKSGGSTCASASTSCNLGSVLSNGACVECETGTFQNATSNQCQLCDINYYQNKTGSTSCNACPNGGVTQGRGAVDNTYCYVTCPAGQYYNGTSCISCPSGTSSSTSGAIQCQPCPSGQYALPGSTTCLVCGSGSEVLASGACVQCNYGTYRNASTSSVCQPCPGGTSTSIKGAQSQNDCNVPLCSSGNYLNTTTSACVACPIGLYQPTSAQVKCICCPDGTTTSSTGSQTVSQCISGQVSKCQTCNPCTSSQQCIDLDGGSYRCDAVGSPYNDRTGVLIGALVGGILGGLLLIIIIVVIICYCKSKQNSKKEYLSERDHDPTYHYDNDYLASTGEISRSNRP